MCVCVSVSEGLGQDKKKANLGWLLLAQFHKNSCNEAPAITTRKIGEVLCNNFAGGGCIVVTPSRSLSENSNYFRNVWGGGALTEKGGSHPESCFTDFPVRAALHPSSYRGIVWICLTVWKTLIISNSRRRSGDSSSNHKNNNDKNNDNDNAIMTYNNRSSKSSLKEDDDDDDEE